MKSFASIGRPLAFALAVPFAMPSVAFATGIDAGTLIQNTAQASYETAAGIETVDSNTVTLKVDELLNVAIASLDAGPVSAASGSRVLTFELTNTGNGPESFNLSANPAIAGNDFNVAVDGIAVDTNANGVYDAGVDQILTGPATTALLAADQALTVFVLVTVPAGVADADTSEVTLTAQAATGTGAPGTSFAGAGENASNAVVGSSGAQASANGSLLVGIATVSLVKSATVADPFGGTSPVPGATITYTIRAAVDGSGAVDSLIVSDAIPTGTSYVASSLKLDGAALTDASGDDAGERTASGISVNLGTTAAGSSQSVTFAVTIDQ